MKTYMYISTLFGLLFISTYCMAADLSKGRFVTQNDIPQILSEVANNEYLEYDNIRNKGYSLDACKAAVTLVTKIYQLGSDFRAGKESNILLGGAAQLMAWSLAIRTWKATTDLAGKAVIMQAWNAALEESTEDKSLQLTALVYNWDKTLLTNECLDVFKNTRDVMTIHAFCMIFGKYGEDEERKLLETKLAYIDYFMKDDKIIYGSNRSNIRTAMDNISMRKAENIFQRQLRAYKQ